MATIKCTIFGLIALVTTIGGFYGLCYFLGGLILRGESPRIKQRERCNAGFNCVVFIAIILLLSYLTGVTLCNWR